MTNTTMCECQTVEALAAFFNQLEGLDSPATYAAFALDKLRNAGLLAAEIETGLDIVRATDPTTFDAYFAVLGVELGHYVGL